MKATKGKQIDDFIDGAASDQVGKEKKEEMKKKPERKRGNPSRIPKKLQSFNLPKCFQDGVIQKLADNMFNSDEGRGNKSEFLRRLIEDEAKRQGVEINYFE